MRQGPLIAVLLLASAAQAVTHQLTFTRSDAAHRERIGAGDSLVISFQGNPNTYLRSATLVVHSNKASGAGMLRLTNDGTTLWNIPNSYFNSRNWHGAYTNAYVTIEKTIQPTLQPMGQVRFVLRGTINSLYFQSLTLTYDTPDTVSVAGESEPGEDPSGWLAQDTTLSTGDYLLAYYNGQVATSGWRDRITIEPCQIQFSDSLYRLDTDSYTHAANYHLEFLSDSTVSINGTESLHWIPTIRHGLFLYTEQLDSIHYKALSSLMDNNTLDDYWAIYKTIFESDCPYFLLFPNPSTPSTALPSTSSINWSQPFQVYDLQGRPLPSHALPHNQILIIRQGSHSTLITKH